VRWTIHLHFEVPDNCHFYFLCRNAVRSNAGEDRTVLHTVPLRGGAMQRDTCAYSFRPKIFLTTDARGDSSVLQQNAVLNLYTYICIYIHAQYTLNIDTNNYLISLLDKALLAMLVFCRQVGSCSVHYKLSSSWLLTPTSWLLKQNFRKYFRKSHCEPSVKGYFRRNTFAALLQNTVKQILFNLICYFLKPE
jgi:hypothetical protein